MVMPDYAVKCAKDFRQLLSKKAQVLSDISSGSILHLLLPVLPNTDLTLYVF
jgi:hypothetical protein